MNRLEIPVPTVSVEDALRVADIPRSMLMDTMRKCLDDHLHVCDADCDEDNEYDRSWHREYADITSKIGPETIALVRVCVLGEERYGATHTLEFCYTATPSIPRDWHAIYGINPETGNIDCWAD